MNAKNKKTLYSLYYIPIKEYPGEAMFTKTHLTCNQWLKQLSRPCFAPHPAAMQTQYSDIMQSFLQNVI